MRVYLTGADGMLGTALTAVLDANGHQTYGVSIQDFDIADATAVNRSITGFEPHVVVHAAANAIVDECETAPERAIRVNVAGTRNVVAACRATNSKLVFISSDYVFDGRDDRPDGYREDDIPSPLNVYGLTKVAGERLVSLLADHLVVRTSWLFGGRDVRTDQLLEMVTATCRGEPSELIGDQVGSPTYTVDLAQALGFLIGRTPEVRGVVHVANAGQTSWYEAGEVAWKLLLDLGTVTASAPSPTKVALASRGFVGTRPRRSPLNSDRLASLGWPMPSWQDAVRRFCTAFVDRKAECEGV